MGKAGVKVSSQFLAERLFGFSDSPVVVGRIEYDRLYETVTMEISGPDVPDCDQVRAVITLQQNRAGEKLYSVKFKPVA